MAKATRIQSLRFCSIDVTERTVWTFAELSDGSATELVEITCGGSTDRVMEHLRTAVQVLMSTSVGSELDVADALGIEIEQLQNERFTIQPRILNGGFDTGLLRLIKRIESLRSMSYKAPLG